MQQMDSDDVTTAVQILREDEPPPEKDLAWVGLASVWQWSSAQTRQHEVVAMTMLSSLLL